MRDAREEEYAMMDGGYTVRTEAHSHWVELFECFFFCVEKMKRIYARVVL